MIIALTLSLILVIPMSAFAESLTVTTNKEIYTMDDKAIIVGSVPENAPDGYAVLIKVTGPRGDCAAQNILPAADNSFISRPVRLDECGIGEFTVSAFYADQETKSTFTISKSSQTDAGSKMELRMLKNIMLQAQDAVNTRVKELIEDGYVLPKEVADKYNEGVSEASLALQAIEFGDVAEAKMHMIFSLRDFREVLNALSEGNVARFEQTAEQQAASDGNSDIVGTYNMLQRYYYRLQELAEKNQVDDENQFEAAALLLSNVKRMINESNYEGAERHLERINAILEEIRADLFNQDEEEKEKLVSDTNNTSQAYEDEVRKLTDIAARYEKNALELLNETGPNAGAEAKLQEALSLIASARISIEAQDLESARDDLSAAYHAIDDARRLIEDEENDDESNTSTSNSGENPGDGDSGESSDDDDKDNKGSNKGSNDEDDQ